MLTWTTTLRASAGVALVALVLATPAAQAADCAARDDDEAVVCEVNRVRDDHGLRPLGTDRRLHRAAEAYARDMAQQGFFAHVSPGGATLSDRLREVGYVGDRVAWRAGETLAWGRGRRSTPAATVDAWMRSALHRRVLLGRYREIGVGVADGDPFGGSGSTYAADFGALDR